MNAVGFERDCPKDLRRLSGLELRGDAVGQRVPKGRISRGEIILPNRALLVAAVIRPDRYNVIIGRDLDQGRELGPEFGSRRSERVTDLSSASFSSRLSRHLSPLEMTNLHRPISVQTVGYIDKKSQYRHLRNNSAVVDLGAATGIGAHNNAN